MKPMPMLAVRTVFALSLLLATVMVHAQVPQQMNYQVMLTDDADQPLADQSLQLVFRIYDQESGGEYLWAETHSVTTNSIGVASVILGSATPLSISFDGPLWLQVEADGEILSPRRKLVSAPYSLHDEVGGAGDGHSLDAADGSPVDVVYVGPDGDVTVGDVGLPGNLTVHSGDGSAPGVTIEGSGEFGGRLTIDNGTNAQVASISAINSETGGGQLWLAGDTSGDNGILLVGNWLTSQQPRMDMWGSSRTLTLDMGQSGDDAVQLPGDAIASTEMLDEPGAAAARGAGAGSLSGNMQMVLERQITAPGEGYILAIATLRLNVSHFPGTDPSTEILFGITEAYPAYPITQSNYLRIPDTCPDGVYYHTVTTHGVFAADPGRTMTFNLFVHRVEGAGGFYGHSHMTLLFIPTAYGEVSTIESVARPASGIEDVAEPLSAALGGRAKAGFAKGSASEETMAPQDGGLIAIPQDTLDELLARVRQLEDRMEDYEHSR